MSGTSEAGTSTLSLEAGTQALLPVSSMGSVIGLLPPEALDNLIVVSSKSPSEVAERLRGVGADIESTAHVPISGASVEYDGPMWTCEPLVPDDLTGLSMRLSQALEALDHQKGHLLFENLNVFLLYAAESRVVRFIDHMTELAADHGITGFYAIDTDGVSPETCERLQLSVDTELDSH